MARPLILAAALALALLAVSGAGGTGAQAPRFGGTVVIPSREPACLNPLVSPCKEFNLPIWSVLQGAFEIGPGFSRRPRLVSRADFTTRPPYTLTYHIRPEARWSDGTPLTSRDFVFTYRTRLRYPAHEEDPHRIYVRSVRAIDAKTVRVVLRSRFFFWREGLFDYVLPRHALRGEDLGRIWTDNLDDPKTGRPIGSGPFLVREVKRGSHLTLTRNPRYWGPHRAYLDRIIVLLREPLDPEIVDLFRSGEVDIIQRQYDEVFTSALRRIPGLRVFFPPDSPGWEHLDIRIGPGGHPALRQKLVRRALAYGIDRVEIVRELFGQIGVGLRPLDSAVFRSSTGAYRPNWSIYRYRPAEARRLLERAGCRRGVDGVYSCAGERLRLRFVARGTGPGRRVQTLELIRTQLGRVGVQVVPEYASQPGHDQILGTGAFDVTLFAWFGPGAEGGGMNGLYGCGGDQNYIGYCQRLVTRDLDQSDRILDEAQRGRVLNRADAQMARDVPVIPLFEVPLMVAVRSTIRNFTPSGFIHPTWNAENWWLAAPR